MDRSGPQVVQALLHFFCSRYPAEAAAEIEALGVPTVVALLESQPLPQAAVVFERLRPDVGGDVIERLNDGALRRLFPAVEPTRAALFLSRLEPDVRERRLALLDAPLRKELEGMLRYTPDSAGGIMDPRVTTFRPDATVREGLARLRALGPKRIYQLFIVDDAGRLIGGVPLQELAIADPRQRLGDLMVRGLPVVSATASLEEVVEILEHRRVTTLPVVDIDGMLVGVIRHDALIEATEAEATADIQTMVGVSREERALSPVVFAVKRRLPWLQVNLLTAFLAAAVVGLFEGTIARFTALAVLMPIVAGQSGNTGAQALAVTMRALTLREVRVRHWWRVAFKELSVGFVNGTAVAFVTAVAVFLWSQSIGLGFVIGTSMVGSMMIAGLAGASVPMLLTSLGQDPAQSSSILLTTVTDVVGFMSFLGLATLAAGLL